VLAALPRIFVGTEARLATLVSWLAARMRDAFAAAGMAVPPWRAPRQLLALWRLHERGEEVAAAPERSADGRTEAVVIMQRNGVPFTAHVAARTPEQLSVGG
jgi:hypothetical protein